MVKVTLYSKPGCHLCDDVHDVIVSVGMQRKFDFEVRNILDDPAVFERYQDEIPVVCVNGEEIAKYHLSPERLNYALDNAEAT